jgi:protein SCO1
MSMRRRLSVDLAAGLVVLLALLPACAAGSAKTPPAAGTSASSAAQPGFLAMVGKQAPDFSLLDQFGHRQELSKLQGKIVLLTFVSTRCQDICPLTAQMLTRTKELLGAKAKDVQLVAVNANQIYHGVADVLHWSKVHNMTDRWLFLTGSFHALADVYSTYDVAPGESHTVAVYVIDSAGEVRTIVPVAMSGGLDAEAQALATYVGTVEAA